jgi:hypothetical protein
MGRYWGGQREQTVNLSALPSRVRISPYPLNGNIAQLVEQTDVNRQVTGSTPVISVIGSYINMWLKNKTITP